jgi:hypothetical protein
MHVAVAEQHEVTLAVGSGIWEGRGGPAEDGGVEGTDAGEVSGGDLGPCYCVDLDSSIACGGWQKTQQREEGGGRK